MNLIQSYFYNTPTIMKHIQTFLETCLPWRPTRSWPAYIPESVQVSWQKGFTK